MSDLVQIAVSLAKVQGVFDADELRHVLPGLSSRGDVDAVLADAVRGGLLRRVGGDNYALPKRAPIPMPGATYWSALQRLNPQSCMIGRA